MARPSIVAMTPGPSLTSQRMKDFDCEITGIDITSSEIKGVVIFRTLNPTEFYGFVVELEGILTLEQPDSPLRKIIRINKKIGEADGFVTKSRVWHQIAGDPSVMLKGRLKPSLEKVLQPFQKEFPFAISLCGLLLPAIFQSPSGELRYKLLLYKRLSHGYLKIAERSLQFFGCHDIALNPMNLEPLKLQMLGPSTPSLALDRRSFVAGEEICFVLRFARGCKSSDEPNVSGIWMQLVRCETIFDGKRHNERTKVMQTFTKLTKDLEDFEILDGDLVEITESFETKSCWPPTFNAGFDYALMYVLKMRLNGIDGDPILGTEVEVIIGTTRGNGRKDSAKENQVGMRKEKRSQSLFPSCSSSLSSDPPSYSKFHSRPEFSQSLETLPPQYDEMDSENHC